MDIRLGPNLQGKHSRRKQNEITYLLFNFVITCKKNPRGSLCMLWPFWSVSRGFLTASYRTGFEEEGVQAWRHL